ncbi:MAG TPA: TetR/AcrR family transcriptional regulator [Solirubrobacterales bacterium]|nr:TetR/AcrR family transcriptional regulator [Solirubrobacterales bacterium]
MTLPGPLAKQPVGRTRLSRATVEEHQRERILTAAIAVFAKRGFQQTSIDNIVAAAKTSVGSFYGLFKGKGDCFLHCYERIVSRARRDIEALLPEDAGWPERASAALGGILGLLEEDPMAARIVFVEAQTAGCEGLARYEQTIDSVLPALRGGRSLSAGGESLPANLEEATAAGVAWLLHERLVSGSGAGSRELLPELAAIVIGPYVGEAEARRLARS